MSNPNKNKKQLQSQTTISTVDTWTAPASAVHWELCVECDVGLRHRLACRIPAPCSPPQTHPTFWGHLTKNALFFGRCGCGTLSGTCCMSCSCACVSTPTCTAGAGAGGWAEGAVNEGHLQRLRPTIDAERVPLRRTGRSGWREHTKPFGLSNWATGAEFRVHHLTCAEIGVYAIMHEKNHLLGATYDNAAVMILSNPKMWTHLLLRAGVPGRTDTDTQPWQEKRAWE